MNFKKRIKSIQTTGYNGARTVYNLALIFMPKFDMLDINEASSDGYLGIIGQILYEVVSWFFFFPNLDVVFKIQSMTLQVCI